MDFLSTDFQSNFQKPGQAALQAPPVTFCLQSSTREKITEHLQETRVEEGMLLGSLQVMDAAVVFKTETEIQSNKPPSCNQGTQKCRWS